MNIEEILAQLNEDERAVLTRIAVRLLRGQQTYGKLEIANDGRDFMAELREELDDALVYSAIAQIRAEMDEPIPYKLADASGR